MNESEPSRRAIEDQERLEDRWNLRFKTEILASFLVGLGFIAIPRLLGSNYGMRSGAVQIDLELGNLQVYALMAVGGGVVGGAIRRVRDVIAGENLKRGRMLPFYGGIMGAVFLLILYLVPSWMGLARIEFSPPFLALLCALSSMFHERMWEALEAFLGKHGPTS